MSNIDEQSTNEELVEKEELQPTEVAEEAVKEEVQPSEIAEPTVEKEEAPSSTEIPESATEEPAKEAVVTPATTKGFDVNELVEKAKDLFQKRKIAVIGALAAVAVLIVALVGFKVYDSQPKSLLNVVQVQFSGYEESGTLTYNSEEVLAKLREIAYKKSGFSSKQATGLAQNDPVTFSEVTRDPKYATNDAYSKDANKNSTYETYTIEPQGSYVAITTGIANTSSANIDIITVYKVTRKGSLFTNVSYKYYGFGGYELKDDKLVAKKGISPIDGGGLEDFEVLKEELQRKEYHLIEIQKDEKKSE